MIVSDGSPVRCVGAVVHDADGRLLLVLRANDPGRGLWSLPGGRVKPGETDRSAVAREVDEETGLAVIVGALVGHVTRSGKNITYEIADYSCRSKSTALSPGDDADDAIWADSATFATLERSGELTEGLAETLRSWNCLPRSH